MSGTRTGAERPRTYAKFGEIHHHSRWLDDGLAHLTLFITLLRSLFVSCTVSLKYMITLID